MKTAVRRRRAFPARLPVLLCLLFALVLFYASAYPPRAQQMAYPMEYCDLVEGYAQEYSLDEAHVYAVILCESSFREQAKSSAGALGLMQIMPETGRWIAGRLGEGEAYTDEALLDPDTNIRYGCWYLALLSRLYGGDMDTVSAAYHAGMGNVDKWLQNGEYSRDGVAIDSTPFPATNSYMEKVHAVYEVYKERVQEER